MDARGRDAVIAQYQQRFAVLGPSNHVSHDHWIRFGDDPDRAQGLLSAHAELWRNETTMVTALRYDDFYRREEGVWRFAERALSFLYYVPLADYPQILGGATGCGPMTCRPRPTIRNSCRVGKTIARDPPAAEV